MTNFHKCSCLLNKSLLVVLLWGGVNTQAGKASLAVMPVHFPPSLSATLTEPGKVSLNRVVDALNTQLADRLNATRKFTLVTRSETAMPQIIKEQDFSQSGNVDKADPNVAQEGKLTPAKYLLNATVDDFSDASERTHLPQLNKVGVGRRIRLAVTAKIYDSSTGRLIESAHIQVERKKMRLESANLSWESEETDALLLQAAREAAEKIAQKVVDVAFPVRVLVKREKQITINRGEGGGIKLGQVWNVFALGEDLVDPDTGESLGREEVQIGKVRVINVRPRTATVEIIEDWGIAKGAILRLSPPEQQ